MPDVAIIEYVLHFGFTRPGCQLATLAIVPNSQFLSTLLAFALPAE
ncbi:hypothetical protein PLANPX_3253 [Lacipirellula parvula]|uniref:Uncharacterized protein n=1 Tax=Lacipirellula parvula TaxID=2650471 RepID=A0A5K7XFI7_9BACT|nr:hypothetical protein PLANPX_3253 [Lacipirellula parvula]